MDAAILNRSVSLIRDTASRVNGAEVLVPSTYASAVPAAVRFSGGKEAWAGKEIDATRIVRFILRYRTDVLPTHRVSFLSKEYAVRAVIPDEATKEFVILECEG